MKHQNLFFAAAGMAAVLALGITGRAETYTTPDSVLCLELPGEEWKQEEEESVWVKLSNGDGTWTCLDSGRIWTEEPPSPPVSTAGQSVTVMDEEGLNSQTLYYDEAAGIWANTAGGVYTQVTSQIWQGPDGGSWFLVN